MEEARVANKRRFTEFLDNGNVRAVHPGARRPPPFAGAFARACIGCLGPSPPLVLEHTTTSASCPARRQGQYPDKIRDMMSAKDHRLVVDVNHLRSFEPDLFRRCVRACAPSAPRRATPRRASPCRRGAERPRARAGC